ncbi:MAG: hypothetical protein Q9163_002423 [Psora crenata]
MESKFNGDGIFLGRLALKTYYDYRTSSIQAQLNDLERQRNRTIEKLKAATRYNSTQELLKKYGGSEASKEKPAEKREGKGTPQQSGPGTRRSGRTNLAPPPTANIPRRVHAPDPQETYQQVLHPQAPSPPAPPSPPWQRPVSPLEPSADFAPNAFSAPSEFAPVNEGPRWYDRIMDILLGEDESSPGKRLALICKTCRLVNGQAPPGFKRVEDVGKWRCAGCGTMNGEENDVKSIVASIKDQAAVEVAEDSEESAAEKLARATDLGQESDITQYTSDEGGPDRPAAETEKPTRRSTRAKKSIKRED